MLNWIHVHATCFLPSSLLSAISFLFFFFKQSLLKFMIESKCKLIWWEEKDVETPLKSLISYCRILCMQNVDHIIIILQIWKEWPVLIKKSNFIHIIVSWAAFLIADHFDTNSCDDVFQDQQIMPPLFVAIFMHCILVRVLHKPLRYCRNLFMYFSEKYKVKILIHFWFVAYLSL